MARVLLFGRFADLAGWRERDAPDARDLGGLKIWLAGLDPGLAGALDGPGVQVAVDRALVRGEASIGPASEVAFMPPMSGG